MRDLIFMGDSKESLSGFPDEVKREMGYALRFAQDGKTHDKVKPPNDWKKTMSERIKHTKSSGNVFQDLDVKDSGLHQIKADLGIMLIDLIGKKELTQTKAASLLCIRQPELSRLKGGNLSHYSVERLLGFLNRLNPMPFGNPQQPFSAGSQNPFFPGIFRVRGFWCCGVRHPPG